MIRCVDYGPMETRDLRARLHRIITGAALLEGILSCEERRGDWADAVALWGESAAAWVAEAQRIARGERHG